MGDLSLPPVYAARPAEFLQYFCIFTLITASADFHDVQAFINETWFIRVGTQLDPDLLQLLWYIIISIFTLGGFVGTLLGGHLAIKFGRKGTLLLVNILSLTGAALMGASKCAGIFELIIVGRFLVGLHSGVSLCVQPMYLAEIAPKAWRGAVSMGNSIFLTLGILIGQIAGQRELLGSKQYWHILLSTVSIPALLQILLLPWFPESPRYLFLDKGLEAKALQSLRQLHRANSYRSELEDMEEERVTIQLQHAKGPWQLLTDHSTRWQIITVAMINIGQQLSGINAIYFYATYIFTKAGIAQALIPYATIGTGFCECISALCCSLLIECLGRRTLMLAGYLLMAFSCAAITISLTYQASYFWMPYMTMALLFAFILSFALGPGGVTSTVTGEMFTQTARLPAYMVCGSVNWLSFFIISLTFPFIVENLHHFFFLIFLSNCLLIALFIYIVMPETKNKSFVEIEREFRARNFRGRLTRAAVGGFINNIQMLNLWKP
ncbi:solute carrier family 2, facilitated glucose transporter member 11-like [Narcine bancroftii]|uniref:solute carrier family 2, facilitated glucose transporter member 11-like n=1 Tax=Narcine bancroftii TaxID=1343680 RepID=UPI003831EEDD